MGKREPSIEYLTFINHTECHCVDRHDPSYVHYNSNQHQYDHSLLRTPTNHPEMTTQIHSQSGTNNRSQINNNTCQCVKHFKVFYESIVSSYENDEISLRNNQLCRCDCESENVSCDWLKKGKDGFSIDDRSCILDKRCIRPTCEYGQYIMQIGRCPRFEDKLAGARQLFFD